MYLKRGDNKDELIKAMRKFKKLCEREGVVRDLRKHEYYEKPSDKRKKAAHRSKMTLMRLRQEEEDKRNGIIRNDPEE